MKDLGSKTVRQVDAETLLVCVYRIFFFIIIYFLCTFWWNSERQLQSINNHQSKLSQTLLRLHIFILILIWLFINLFLNSDWNSQSIIKIVYHRTSSESYPVLAWQNVNSISFQICIRDFFFNYIFYMSTNHGSFTIFSIYQETCNNILSQSWIIIWNLARTVSPWNRNTFAKGICLSEKSLHVSFSCNLHWNFQFHVRLKVCYKINKWEYFFCG